MSDDEVEVEEIVYELTVLEQVYDVTVQSAGLPGPPGPTGPAGGAQFEEVWSSPVSSVIVTHNLHRYPAVVIILSGSPVLADVTYNSIDQITVTFAGPQGPGRIECI
jgi:hypothetical protein